MAFPSTASASELDVLVFGSLEGGTSAFLTAGLKIAPKSSPYDGPVMLVSVGGGAGIDRLACGCTAPHAQGHYAATASAVFGYQWTSPEGVIAAFVGPEATLDGYDPGTIAFHRDSEAGLRVQGEAWLHPSEATLMQATLIAGTAKESIWARLAWGYAAWSAYFGPEASLYADTTGYAKVSFGLHLTGLSFAAATFRVSAGATYEPRDRRLSPYFGLTAWRPW